MRTALVKRTVRIGNPDGLHLRPAGAVCREAERFNCSCRMEIGQSTYNLQSVISVLSARISRPKTVVLICDGPEEEQALKELGDFLEGPIQ